MTLETMTGGCRCGSIRYHIPGAPKFQVQCHCRQCQQTSGGGHASIMVCSNEGFEMSGKASTYSYTSGDGNEVTHHFCQCCGAPLFNTNSKFAKAVYVMVGSLDDPTVFEPQRHIFTGEGYDWDPKNPDLSHEITLPGR